MAAAPTLEFEKPIAELEKQIDELKRLADERRLEVTDEIAPLEVRWADQSGARARFRSRSLTLAASNAALTELRALLGQERVKLVRGS